ncbi:VOC family protein [bacterium]|nr:MAG: VOC family protein [bacterium]
MKINHLNLTVTDVALARDFLAKYFGLRPASQGPISDRIALMFDDNDMVLTLMSEGDKEVNYPSSFHIGFIQPSEEKVNELNQRLKDDGFDVKPPRRFHGSWTFYFKAPGGVLIEVLH